MANTYRVYCYTNQVTGQKYVGCTHLHQSTRAGKNGRQYVKTCSAFGAAITKYGWNNFQYEVLENNLTKEQAEVNEQFWISKLDTIYPNGYNLDSGGRSGHKEHNITKQKISDSRLGEKHHYFGKHLQKEHKNKISVSMTGVNTWAKGRHWYNNGLLETQSDFCPDGWNKGRLQRNQSV